MKQKEFTSEQIIAKLGEAEVLLNKWQTAVDSSHCLSIGDDMWKGELNVVDCNQNGFPFSP